MSVLRTIKKTKQKLKIHKETETIVTDVMAKIAVIIFNFLETFMISWNIVNMMFLCVHCLNDDWQWRDDLETDKAKIKLGLNTTFWNLLCLICFSISHILLDLLEDIDGSIVTYISVDELTWIIAFNIIFFAIYISFFIKAKKWDKKLAKEENAVEAESEKEDDSE